MKQTKNFILIAGDRFYSPAVKEDSLINFNSY